MLVVLASWKDVGGKVPNSYILSRPGPEHRPQASLVKVPALQECQVGLGEQQSNQLLPLSLYHGPEVPGWWGVG